VHQEFALSCLTAVVSGTAFYVHLTILCALAAPTPIPSLQTRLRGVDFLQLALVLLWGMNRYTCFVTHFEAIVPVQHKTEQGQWNIE
jgi:hypothetical protein